MKKLIIILPLFLMTFFSFYYQETENEKVSVPDSIEKLKQKEDSPIKRKNKEHNQTEAKLFSVEIPAEINTTRDNTTNITAQIKNTNNVEACNLFWYENKKLIGMGTTLEHSYSKGTHTITVLAKDSEGHESNATATVIAWDYIKIKTSIFNDDSGDLDHEEIEIYDHKGHCILMDDQIYQKSIDIYDDNDNLIEAKVIYYESPKNNMQVFYTYDKNHNQLTAKSISLFTGETLYYYLRTYDKDGNLTSSKSGKNEDNLKNDFSDEDYSEDNKSNDIDEKNKTIRNEAGFITYQENSYKNTKMTDEYSYDSNNSITQIISTMITDNKHNSNTYIYDKHNNLTSLEQIQKTDEEVTCHFKVTYTYYENGYQATEKKEILDGECPGAKADTSFKKFDYDKDGRIVNISSSLNKKADDNISILNVIKTYTNELDY